MKNKTICIAIIFIGFVISCPVVCHSELIKKKERSDKWILFGKSSVGIHYYDKRSIEKISSRIIKVWTRVKLSHDEKNKLIQERIKHNLPTGGWEELSEEVALNELDCENKTHKVSKLSNYDCQGRVINDLDLSNTEREKVMPETINEGLVRIACMNK